MQGLSSIFSGGLCGTGFIGGNPERIPIVASNFIYAGLGEELDYTGLLVGSFLFLAFFRRAFRGSSLTADPYSALLSLEFASFIALQTFLNICNVTKTIPLTGILPSLYQSRR